MIRKAKRYAMSNYVVDPRMDRVFKRLFGTENNKDILLGFLNDILVNNIKSAIVEIELLSGEYAPTHILEKEIAIDVLCRDANGDKFIIEMQRRDSDDFIKRAQYYASRVYSAQLDIKQKYGELKKLFFIAIVDYELFPDHNDYRTDYSFYDKKHDGKHLDDFHFIFIELPKFEKTLASELTSEEEKWCFFFNEIQNFNEIEKIASKDSKPIARAWKEVQIASLTFEQKMQYDLEVIARIDLELYDEKMDRDVKAAAEKYGAKGLEKGLELGKAEGLELGKAEGLELGKAEGLELGKAEGLELGKAEGLELGKAEGEKLKQIEIAKNMILLSIDLGIVSKATGLSIEEIQDIKNKK